MMTRSLILMRHAKSSWGDPRFGDHDRPLSARGQRSACALGNWLRAQDLLPDQVLSSSARRTRETFAGLDIAVEAAFTEALYHAGPADLFKALRGATGRRVLMLGHNPGIAYFAAELLRIAPDHPRFSCHAPPGPP
jgi:phosphohistidine phosphatase